MLGAILCVRPRLLLQASNVAKLLDDASYKAVYNTIRDQLNAKGKRPPADVDPQALTAADTMSPEEFEKVFKIALKQPTAEAARDLAMMTSMHAGGSCLLHLDPSWCSAVHSSPTLAVHPFVATWPNPSKFDSAAAAVAAKISAAATASHSTLASMSAQAFAAQMTRACSTWQTSSSHAASAALVRRQTALWATPLRRAVVFRNEADIEYADAC